MTLNDFEKALVKHLKTHSTVGSLVSDRISFSVAPQESVYPYIVIYWIAESSVYTFDGPYGLVSPTLQFTIVGDSHGSCSDVRQAIHSAFAKCPFTVIVNGSPVTVAMAVRKSSNTFFDEKVQKPYHVMRYDFYLSE